MTDYNGDICWMKTMEHCESDVQAAIAGDGTIYLAVNEYVDPLVKIRRTGRLICLLPDGAEKWNFSFPGKDSLYFNSNLVLYKDTLYVSVASSQQFSHGFEQGVYVFDKNGEYKWNWPCDRLVNGLVGDSKGNIYMADNEGSFYCLNADNGFVVKKIDKPVVEGKAIVYQQTTASPKQKEILERILNVEVLQAYSHSHSQNGVLFIALKRQAGVLVILKIAAV